MGKITFILGGARSGKSSFAMQLAQGCKGKIGFVATGQAKDAEMRRRIKLHQKNRPQHWQTFETARDLTSVIKKISKHYDCLIIDCLTLWVSNLLLAGCSEGLMEKEIKQIISLLKKSKARAIIVSNEVGLGIVPRNKLARDFRDIAGRVNQLTASGADSVFFLISGLAQKIK